MNLVLAGVLALVLFAAGLVAWVGQAMERALHGRIGDSKP